MGSLTHHSQFLAFQVYDVPKMFNVTIPGKTGYDGLGIRMLVDNTGIGTFRGNPLSFTNTSMYIW